MKKSPPTLTGILTHFADVPDPRIERTKRHQLSNMIAIAICAIICGADDWVAVEKYGWAKLKWLRTFLDLPNGIPSHDTFGRVFARLNPEAFQLAFSAWINAAFELTVGQVIALDGKKLRHSYDTWDGKAAIHMVSAWATANHLVLGQRKVDVKSNEITAIPELLQLLNLAGCIVTIDAMGCQKTIAAQVIAQDGDYILALKENQPHLYDDVVRLFEWADNINYADLEHDTARETGKGHGRVETRVCDTLSGDAVTGMLTHSTEWAGLDTVIRIQATRRSGDAETQETRYYLSSLATERPKLAQTALHSVRRHWGIENELHWVLDVAFQEDASRIRKGHGAENMAVLRHIVLSLLNQEAERSVGIKNRRLMAGWNPDSLLSVLAI